MGGDHFLSDFEQHGLDAVGGLPVAEDAAAGGIHDPRVFRDAMHSHLGDEADGGWVLGVLLAAGERERVDAVLEDGVERPQYRPVPPRQRYVIGILETVAYRSVTDAVLASLELLEQTEVPRY